MSDGDHGQEDEAEGQAGGQAEESGLRSSLAPQQGLVHQRGLGPFAIDSQKRRQSQRSLPAQLQAVAGLFLEEVHPPLGLELGDQPVADVEEHARGRQHHHALEDLASRA